MRKLVTLAAALTGTLMAFSVSANEASPNAEQIIKHRQAIMMAIGGHMSSTHGSMRSPEFSADQLYHIEQINELAKISAKTFPKSSENGKSKSSADVWAKPEVFKKEMDDFLMKAQAAVDAGKKGTKDKEYLAAVKSLTESCKSCHKQFKED